MERTYRNQFPPEYAVPPELIAGLEKLGFTDSSCDNDLCPSWSYVMPSIAEGVRITVWIDHPDKAQRGLGFNRFLVVIYFGGDFANAGTHDSEIGVILDMAAWTQRMLTSVHREVLDLLTLHPQITSFSDLHDHVDANVLGDFEEGCAYWGTKYAHLLVETPTPEQPEFDAARDWFFDIVGAVQSTIHWWLQNRPRPRPRNSAPGRRLPSKEDP